MNNLSVLLVDDTADTLEVMAICLAGLGHDVVTASGGREAISKMEDRVFDLVITDVLMPETDGIQVIMAARQLQPDAQVIAMTGGGEFFAARDLLNLAAKLGSAAQLSKPFTQSQLTEAIAEVCGQRALLANVA